MEEDISNYSPTVMFRGTRDTLYINIILLRLLGTSKVLLLNYQTIIKGILDAISTDLSRSGLQQSIFI